MAPVVGSGSIAARTHRVDPETGKRTYCIIQAEDELAAIGMVIGASWNGARAFTATSGPGLSLMNEFLGLAYFAEIPAVLINVQRTGPSTGMPTRIWRSIFPRAIVPRTERERHKTILEFFVLHMRPVRVRQSTLPYTHTFGLGGSSLTLVALVGPTASGKTGAGKRRNKQQPCATSDHDCSSPSSR